MLNFMIITFLTIVYIFLLDFGLKTRKLALYPMESGKVFLNIVPPIDTRSYKQWPLLVKATVDWITCIKGGTVF